ncbi:MAG: terminase gpA endonuclease subunit, partial [Pseudoxanthomonas sp.]
MIDTCPALSERVQEARSRDSGNTVLMKEFQGGALVITGAISGPGLRSLPIRYAFMDEIDAYPADVSGEGDPVALVEKRTDTFTRKKRYKVSTPTEKGLSRIDAEYQASDQRRFYVPCPHCTEKQWLQWEQVRWTTTTLHELACTQCGVLSAVAADEAACPACGAAVSDDALHEHVTGELEKVWYECSHCHGEIGEHHKTAMLAAGTWLAQSPGAGKAAGFHLSALYSPVGWFSWAQAVQEYLRAQNDLENGTELKKVWTNTVLGQVFETPGQRV